MSRTVGFKKEKELIVSIGPRLRNESTVLKRKWIYDKRLRSDYLRVGEKSRLGEGTGALRENQNTVSNIGKNRFELRKVNKASALPGEAIFQGQFRD